MQYLGLLSVLDSASQFFVRETVQEQIKEKSKEKLQDTVDGGKSEIKA